MREYRKNKNKKASDSGGDFARNEVVPPDKEKGQLHSTQLQPGSCPASAVHADRRYLTGVSTRTMFKVSRPSR